MLNRNREGTPRRILSYGRPYWRRLVFGTILLLLSSSISLSLPWLVRRPIGMILSGREIPSPMAFIGLLFLFFLQAVFSFGHNYVSGEVGQNVLADLRVALFSHLQTLSLPFFSKRRTGELLSRLTNDLGVVQTLATELPVTLIRQALILIGGLTIILYMNWRLTFLSLILIPIVVVAARFMGKRLRDLSTSVHDQMAGTTNLMEEMIAGIRTIKSFGREEYEQARFSAQVKKALKLMLHRLRISSAFGPMMVFLGLSAASGLLWYGAREILHGKIKPEDVIAFVMYAMIITGPIGSFARLFTQLQEGLGASKRVFELLDTLPQISDAPEAQPVPPIKGHIRFSHVSFQYIPGQPVLKNINLCVQPGEKVALVGPSGAGKSTLIHLLHRFYDPSSGTIEVDGYPLRESQIKSYYDQIAYVPQEVVLFVGTLRENILYGRLDADEEALIAASKAAHAHDFIMNFSEGYETVVGEKGLTLSGGERQRIAIARAFLKNPRLLILDEATAFLDTASESFVKDALERLMAGKTTFMIAHRLTTIRKADRIVVFNKGSLVEEGTHEKLMRLNGLYHHLITLKSEVDSETVFPPT